ncbi:MAG: helix-turn-helix transcriptional regulator [[Clostridium] fimetarium]|nr:helix-turn-helix transcriptional regulator [Alistipes timonensis]MCM1404981.1 helix-turn-helix transcriptional regulator [[Clostridium] fimetarium]
MDIRGKLTTELSRHNSNAETTSDASMERFTRIAEVYASVENVLAVLSDLNNGKSYVAHGHFSNIIDIDRDKCSGYIPSIWEDDVFQAIHTNDLERKMLQELLFFHHIKRLPKSRRFQQCLIQRIRMRSKNGEWIETLHRLHYIPADDGKTIRFALCLYGGANFGFKSDSVIMDTVTGQITELAPSEGAKILSPQETEVLKLIDEGNRSKGIADILCISPHTVSRHRQNIIAKLKVRNSAEACKVARGLNILPRF